MRVLVTGGRDFTDEKMMRAVLGVLSPGTVLVHGAAPGADYLAGYTWKSWGRDVEPHPADWEGECRPTCRPKHRMQRGSGTYCPAAGIYRNTEMLETSIDIAIAFPGGTGTADMIAQCLTAGVYVAKVT